jgi:hypothetical protein
MKTASGLRTLIAHSEHFCMCAALADQTNFDRSNLEGDAGLLDVAA